MGMPGASPPTLFQRRSAPVRVLVVAIAAVAVAEAAVWLLRPRDEGVEPLAVSAAEVLPTAQLERARDYRNGQRALLLAGIAVEAGFLVMLVSGRPRFAARRLDGLGVRPWLGGAAAGAAISLTLTLVELPVGAIAHERATDYGLSTQDWGSWFADRGKTALIAAGFAAMGGAVLLALIRRYPRSWWAPAAGVAVGYSLVVTALAPVVLEPLFNRFEPLPEGRERSAVTELAERAGVEIGEVYQVDASRRSTTLNAYVTGLGPTKRVVIYDNLLESTEEDALRSVVAHELAHQRNEDLWRGLAYVAIVAPLGLLFVRELGTALARRGGLRPASPAALPGYALGLGLAVLALGVPGNQLSRSVEAAADDFALELTRDPAALIELQTELGERNLSDPDPPGWYEALFATHPSMVERIGAARAWEQQAPGSGPSPTPRRPPTREGS
jgi:STE24 endopeptidase